MTYEIMDEFIVLKVVPEEKKNVLNIVGQVTDKNKVPLPGVTVIVKGSNLGTATDQEGRYRLNIPEIKNLSFFFHRDENPRSGVYGQRYDKRGHGGGSGSHG